MRQLFNIVVPVMLFLNCTSPEEGPPLLFVPDDLEVILWSESPDFYNPTNIDVDAKGRVWVTEAVNYRDFRNAEDHKVHEGGDRVVILEDSNGDGKANSSKVFVQDPDLRSPLGLAVVGNRVIVSCAPHIIIYTDENEDDIPDKKDIFLTGFGGRDHDHGLHAGVLGPDGKWYFIVGNAGPHQVTDRDGWNLRSGSVYNEYTPYTQENLPNQVSDDGNVYTGGLIIRVNQDGTGMQVMSHNFRNAYEVAVDSFGNMWQSDNDDQTASCRTTWLMEGSNAGFFSANGERTWQADRRPGQTVPIAHWHQNDPGVLPAGDIYGAGSPTGIVRLEGDELGNAYQGMLLSADAGRNIIFGYHPTLRGAGYPLEERTAFISSVKVDNTNYIWHEVEDDQSKWFRPSDIAVGTEGALYVADWFDPIVGGHRMMDKTGHGKIYKIQPAKKPLEKPKLDFSSIEGLVQAFQNPAIHVRGYAREGLLKEGQASIPALLPLLQSVNPFIQARAIWLLAELGEWDKVRSFLDHYDAELALAAFRALRQFDKDNLLNNALIALEAKHPVVMAEMAISLQALPLDQSRDLLFSIIGTFDGHDPWLLHALGIGFATHGQNIYLELLRYFDAKEPEAWPQPLAKLVWELHPSEAVDDLAIRVAKLTGKERDESMTALAFINTPKAADVIRNYYANASGEEKSQAQWWLQFRKTNEWKTFLADWESPQDNFPHVEPEVLVFKSTLMDTLALKEDREKAIIILASESQGRLHLTQLAIMNRLSEKEKDIAAKWMDAETSLANKSLLAHYFPLDPPKVLNKSGVERTRTSSGQGEMLAIRHCSVCHSIGKLENEIGPDLRQVNQKFSKSGLIEAILEPDAAVGFGSETFLIELNTGAMLYGMLQSSGPVVTVMESSGRKHLIPSEMIKGRRQLPHSLMPNPVWMDISENEIGQIAAYLIGG
jgi:putative membrane-bound dehydrogenase-like protein